MAAKLPFTTNPTTLITPQFSEQQPQIAETAKVSQSDLEKYLTVETALLGVSDNISLYYKDLADPQKQISIDPTKSWIPASTIKSYVILEAFRQKDLGLIKFDTEVTVLSQNVVPTELETDEFLRLREGTKATIRQLVEAMIIQSDNTAYNTLLDILDRRNINLALRNIGITETVVGEKLNLDENQFLKDLQVPGRQSNTTTAKDLATFFDLLYNKKIADSDEILTIFERQKINNMIPASLPTNIIVAHKTGDWASIYHDGGVVFKPNNPFILTVFTNSGDPKIIAQMAKVAYFQTADSVGQAEGPLSQTISQDIKKSYPLITLAKLPASSEVLAAETPEKFPEVTASDLGITPRDFNSNINQASNFSYAFLTPGSILYKVKQFFESQELKNAVNNTDLVKVHLDFAKSRLAEVKALMGSGHVKEANSILAESENQLNQATDLAKKDPVNKDLLLSEIKNVNDLHFAVLAKIGQSIPKESKNEFIDSVYNFYKENQKSVIPAVNSSVIANPIQQKPAVGQVTQIQNNEATLTFDDGSTRQIILPTGTKVRTFQQDSYQGIDSIKAGDRIAVLGLTNKESKVIPQFILKNVPKELPNIHTGTVIEINPDANTLKIIDKQGQIEEINILDKTTIKAKDTNVSLEGIKAGSQVTVFGTTPSTPTSSVLPSSGTPIPPGNQGPGKGGSSSQTQSKQTNQNPGNPNAPQGANQPSSNTPVIQIKATSVTVTKNGSGAQEKVEPKKEEPKKAEPQSKETKPQDKKK